MVSSHDGKDGKLWHDFHSCSDILHSPASARWFGLNLFNGELSWSDDKNGAAKNTVQVKGAQIKLEGVSLEVSNGMKKRFVKCLKYLTSLPRWLPKAEPYIYGEEMPRRRKCGLMQLRQLVHSQHTADTPCTVQGLNDEPVPDLRGLGGAYQEESNVRNGRGSNVSTDGRGSNVSVDPRSRG